MHALARWFGKVVRACSTASVLAFIACGDGADTPPAVPPERTRTLAELDGEERDALCDWTNERTFGDPAVRRAACTFGGLVGSAGESRSFCEELRDNCIHRLPIESVFPCFADPDVTTVSCPDSLVGEHLDCIEEHRQDTLDAYGALSCKDTSSYPSESLAARSQRVRSRPGCAALLASCPSFFDAMLEPRPDA